MFITLYGASPLLAQSGGIIQSTVIQKISKPNDRLEMTVNTSRILTLQTRIPRLVVTNPDVVTATPISENQVQIAARKPGVTQINLWDEEGKVYTVDLLIFGDVRELDLMLKKMFPESSIQVVRLSQSLVLEGQVDRPEIVSTIRHLAEDYAPKVINNINVGGVQQILLKVKVMEVSRTKLRRMGFDWANFSGDDFIVSSVSGILDAVVPGTQTATGAGATVEFGIVDGNNAFFGFLEALQQNNLAKILADPTITTVSGRPAHFNVGGELPIIVPSGLGQTTIEYKKFGTQVDFLPIVLGDGRIRLEVRPRVSEIDDSRSVTINGFTVPALKVREVDTGVELNAGQTLALAGLVQTRIDAQHRGLPYISDLPYIGAAFRRVEEEVNEIELLIMVTPEFVDGLDPHEVPCCGPGMESVSPTHCDLYMKGYIEVPNCGPCGAGVGPIGPGCENGACAPMGGGAVDMGCPPADGATYGYAEGGMIPSGEGSGVPMMVSPPVEVPSSDAPEPTLPTIPPQPADGNLPDPSAGGGPAPWNRGQLSGVQVSNPHYRTAERPTPATGAATTLPATGAVTTPPATGAATTTPGLIGPIGYDVEK